MKTLSLGEIRQKEILKQERKEAKKEKKDKKLRDKYFWFANDGKICPDCGASLESPNHVQSYINGEYGDVEFYIDCPYCKFKYSTVSDESIDMVKTYYNMLKSQPKTKSSFLKRLFKKGQ